MHSKKRKSGHDCQDDSSTTIDITQQTKHFKGSSGIRKSDAIVKTTESERLDVVPLVQRQPLVIDLSDEIEEKQQVLTLKPNQTARLKSMPRPERSFPRFASGNVVIRLDAYDHTYRLHSDLLTTASKWFRDTVDLDVLWLEADRYKAAKAMKQYNIRATYELVFDPIRKIFILERSSLTYMDDSQRLPSKPLALNKGSSDSAQIDPKISPKKDERQVIHSIVKTATHPMEPPNQEHQSVSEILIDTGLNAMPSTPFEKPAIGNKIATSLDEDIMADSNGNVTTEIQNKVDAETPGPISGETGTKNGNDVPSRHVSRLALENEMAASLDDTMTADSNKEVTTEIQSRVDADIPGLISGYTESKDGNEQTPAPATDKKIPCKTEEPPEHKEQPRGLDSATPQDHAAGTLKVTGFTAVGTKEEVAKKKKGVARFAKASNHFVAPPVETRTRHELVLAHHNLFRTLYNKPLELDVSSAESVLDQAELLIDVARFYGAIRSVRPHICSALMSLRDLHLAIMRDPPRWMQLAYYLESAPIFREAMIHAVGSHPWWPWSSFYPPELFEQSKILAERKLVELKALKAAAAESLLKSQLKVGDVDLTIHTVTKATLGPWFVEQQWRHWFTGALAEANRTAPGTNAEFEDNRRCEHAGVYRLLRKGGDTYLSLAEVLDRLEALKGDGEEFSTAQRHEVERVLKALKEYAQEQVGALCVNNSMLKVEELGINYFTCIDVKDDEMPWIKPDGAAVPERNGV